MKKITLFFISSFAILFFSCTKDEQQTEIEKSWLEDINYFAEELPKRQLDFYKLIDKKEFETKIDCLKNNIDSLDGFAITFELQKILSSLNVSHTCIPIKYSNLPITVELFDDGLFILGIDQSKKEYLNRKIVSINKIDVDEIYLRLKPYLSFENKYWLKKQIPEIIIKPKVLKYINVIENEGQTTFELENGDSFKLTIQSTGSEMAFSHIFTELTYLKNSKKYYWYDMIADHILYIQYNKCKEDNNYPFSSFVNEINQIIGNNSVNTILVDLRLNTGGNSAIINPLIEMLKNHSDKKIYGAISRRTYSSGRFAVKDLITHFNAELFGEPTGGSPHSYGESKSFVLPYSKTTVYYCVKYFNLMESDFDYFEPHNRFEYNAGNLFEGKDLVLDHVLMERN